MLKKYDFFLSLCYLRVPLKNVSPFGSAVYREHIYECLVLLFRYIYSVFCSFMTFQKI